jgi:hypothetical protein
MNRTTSMTESLESRRLFAAALALTANNGLIEFDTDSPGTLTRGVQVTGLVGDERLVSIDYRQSTSVLYGLTNASRLYAISTTTGAATPAGDAFDVPLTASRASIDFNPFADALRVVGSNGQNLRVNPDNGNVVDANTGTAGVQGDATLAYAGGDSGAGATPFVSGIAYSGNFSGTPATTLYGLDTGRNVLVTQGSPGGSPTSPNTGTLNTVGALGVDLTSRASMEIVTSSRGNEAIVIGTIEGVTGNQVFRVDLTSGQMTFLGSLGARGLIVGFTVVPPQYTALALSSDNRIVQLDVSSPNRPLNTLRIRTAEGVGILALDFDTNTNRLLGLGSNSQIYVINPRNGRVSPLARPIGIPIEGQLFAIDTNPVTNEIRLVSNTEQNLRINSITGALISRDPAIAYAAGDPNQPGEPSVAAVAHTNNFQRAPSTTLFGIGAAANSLVTIGSSGGLVSSPNTGNLFTRNTLGLRVESQSGLDIVTANGIDRAIAVLEPVKAGRFGLYDVNLRNEQVVRIGTMPPGRFSDIAIVPGGLDLDV